jgi:hypothetical protein
MSSILSGFADADAWAYTVDGVIVGRARDRSYKEVARAGVPIDAFMDTTATPVESCIINPVPYEAPPYLALEDEDLDDFDQYIDLGRHNRRGVLRARRVGVKKPKYGPKASKARTVAAKIFAEPPPSNDVTETPAASEPAVATTDTEPRVQFHHVLSAFLDDLDRLAQHLEGHGFYLTEEEEAAERLMIRIRNSRYER